MSLTREDVMHVATLARLGLGEEEITRMQEQLSSILGHIEVLNELNTASIPPTAQVISLNNIWREDTVRESLPQSEVERIAPEHRGGFITVPQVMGGTDDEGGSA